MKMKRSEEIAVYLVTDAGKAYFWSADKVMLLGYSA